MQLKPDSNANVLVVYSGGTFGMASSPKGLIPTNNLRTLIKQAIPEASLEQFPSFDIIELNPLIDSANLLPSMWRSIAEPIINHYREYDGFVVIHGTDTMAYSASALSFMLRGLSKPVVFTGSQIPLALPRSDAINNFMHALIYAGSQALQEVALCFSDSLFRGNRSVKSDAMAFNAFESPNYPVLGKADISITLDEKQLWRKNHTLAFYNKQFDNKAVAVLKIYPGMDSSLLTTLAKNGNCKAVVLSSFGTGNLPMSNPCFVDGVKRLLQEDILIINTSQCLAGLNVPGHYACSSELDAMGIINGGDMTSEAAFAKAHVILANDLHPRELSHQLAGEASFSH